MGGSSGQISREINSLLKLYKKEHFPILLSKNINKKTIFLHNCGIPLNNDNIPSNWKQQILQIISTLNQCNVSNNDMWKNNFLVNDGTIYLVDFGWATTDPYYPFINITKHQIIV